ncbi:hypothetical protein H7F15_17995 [Pontibacter sp. Tf4]|uniref:hypothetical protein n=1 Tax=Pontibacter sp. Tf4 TaxID=2761620 RepID=UPI00162830F6|nr:hypothetical protein [Pontibacter sp. Tf4]MBB6612938.1 hypothetical protein [Pontibacter sp. Tf4]
MRRYLVIVLAIVCFACKEQKQTETIVAENSEPVKAEEIEFEKITLSMWCPCPKWNTKDLEILSDGTFYYRLRDDYDEAMRENYKGEIDSIGMAQVYTFLDSLDFNTLKASLTEAQDAADHSIHIKLSDGEVKLRGDLDDKGALAVYKLFKFIDKNKMSVNESHYFSTEKEVRFIPPYPLP